MKLIEILKDIAGDNLLRPSVTIAISEAELMERKAKAFDWLATNGDSVWKWPGDGLYWLRSNIENYEGKGFPTALEAVESAQKEAGR